MDINTPIKNFIKVKKYFGWYGKGSRTSSKGCLAL
jgi:hypothetical protein